LNSEEKKEKESKGAFLGHRSLYAMRPSKQGGPKNLAHCIGGGEALVTEGT